MFERIGLRRKPERDSRLLLLIGSAGGVGSIAIQMARHLADLTVVASASHDETRDWCLEMGADHVIDHSRPMMPQLQALDLARDSRSNRRSPSARGAPEARSVSL
jgi:NADPH2:quinone reductase